jgi:hypothetical protein
MIDHPSLDSLDFRGDLSVDEEKSTAMVMLFDGTKVHGNREQPHLDFSRIAYPVLPD